jgi:hypothetical protein
MDEKDLYRIALVMMAIGFIVLLFYAELSPNQVTKTIAEASSGEDIKLSGTIIKATAKEKVWFVKIEGCTPTVTEATIFTQEPLFLQQGDYVEAEGKVEEYNGTRTVILSKVIKK